MKTRVVRFYVCAAAAGAAIVLALALRWVHAAPEGPIMLPPSPVITPEPADIVYVTPSGTKYHRADCASLANAASTENMPPDEALERGYAPCLKCEPGNGS